MVVNYDMDLFSVYLDFEQSVAHFVEVLGFLEHLVVFVVQVEGV